MENNINAILSKRLGEVRSISLSLTASTCNFSKS